MRAKLHHAALVLVLGLGGSSATAADHKVLTTGAYRPVAQALVPDFEKLTADKVTLENETAGGLKKRIAAGAAFDVLVITPALIDELTRAGKLAPGSARKVAGVGIGVAVKEGAPKPDISTAEKFKEALLAAKSVAYLDPAAGGSSGIYLDKLGQKLGIAEQIRAKAKLKQGGHVADLVVSGEAELGIHQISEIIAVKGAALVGPLPREIQNTTIYTAALSASSQQSEAGKVLMDILAGPAAAPVLKSKGMEPAS
jgi:molybdate transport system substrate-binding protein